LAVNNSSAASGSGVSAVVAKQRFFIAAIASVAAAACIVAVISFSSPNPEMAASGITGDILFHGNDSEYGHVNPTRVTLQVDSQYGSVTVLDWNITALNDDRILYGGEGENATPALIKMAEDGVIGEYVLYYIVEDSFGYVYSVSRSFIII